MHRLASRHSGLWQSYRSSVPKHGVSPQAACKRRISAPLSVQGLRIPTALLCGAVDGLLFMAATSSLPTTRLESSAAARYFLDPGQQRFRIGFLMPWTPTHERILRGDSAEAGWKTQRSQRRRGRKEISSVLIPKLCALRVSAPSALPTRPTPSPAAPDAGGCGCSCSRAAGSRSASAPWRRGCRRSGRWRDR